MPHKAPFEPGKGHQSKPIGIAGALDSRVPHEIRRRREESQRA